MSRGRLSTFQRLLVLLVLVFVGWSLQSTAQASPFGEGVFGADVPFGSLTSIAIDLGSNVSLNLAPSGGNYSGTGSHVITVTSTDVVGYQLYVYSTGSTSLVNGSYSIPASGNSIPGTLAVNSWGYNTDGSGNFVGITTVPAVLKTATGPFKTGDATTVTYGALADITKGAGDYTATVTYTAVGLND